MGFLEKLKKSKAPQSAAQPVSANSAPAAASNQAAIGGGISSPGLFSRLKSRLGFGDNSAAPSAAPQKSKMERANDWVEGKIASADKFIQDNTFGGKSKVFNGLLGAYDKVRNLQDDFHDWKGEMSEKYHNSAFGKKMDGVKAKIKGLFHSDKPGLMDKIKAKYEGSALQKGVNKVKGGLSSAGKFIKDKASAAGGWVKDKASAAGNWIKSKLHSDKPGLMDKIKAKYEGSALQRGVNKVKDKYEGSALQRGVNKTKNGLVSAGKWVKNTASSAADWVKDKKNRATDYIADMKDQLAAHDEERYEKHRTEKYGAEYLKQKAAYEMLLKNGEIGQNVAELGDVDALLGPDEEEEGSSFKDKIKEQLSNKHDLINNAVGLATKGAGTLVGKVLPKELEDYGDPISGSLKALSHATQFGTATKEKHDVKKLDQDHVTAGVHDERGKKKMMRAQNALVSELSRKQVQSGSKFISKAAKSAGQFADLLGAGGLGSTIGNAVSKAAKAGGSYIEGKMRDKDDKNIAKEAIFGDKDTYKAIKGNFNLLRAKDMKIGMSRATNARNISDIAERSRYDMAKTLNSARGKDQGGYNMLKARGYTDDGISRMTDEKTANELGLKQTRREMRRRKRLA